MQKNTENEIQPSDLKRQLLEQEKPETSESLPQSVSMQLLNLMKTVVKEEVNPSTVKAACQCASEIHKMLKLNLELKRSGL